jgi:hypothetical protein
MDIFPRQFDGSPEFSISSFHFAFIIWNTLKFPDNFKYDGLVKGPVFVILAEVKEL